MNDLKNINNSKTVKISLETWELLQNIKSDTGVPINRIIKDSVTKIYKNIKETK